MSKKCIKCGQKDASSGISCPHCTAVQTEKKEIKPPRRWKKKALIILTILILSAVVGTVFLMHHKPQKYEGGAQIVYQDKDKSYKVLLTFSQEDGVTGHALGKKYQTICIQTGS